MGEMRLDGGGKEMAALSPTRFDHLQHSLDKPTATGALHFKSAAVYPKECSYGVNGDLTTPETGIKLYIAPPS